MTRALDDMRPPVFGEETARQLRPLLRFRHFVRHAYAVPWDLTRIEEVLASALRAWPRVRADMDEFLAFLDDVIAGM